MIIKTIICAILLCVYLSETLAQEDNETAIEWIERDSFGRKVNKTIFCENAVCIRKCCNSGFIVRQTTEFPDSGRCVRDEIRRDAMDPKIYDKDIEITQKKAKDIFKFLSGRNIMETGYYMYPYMNLYLLETGTLMVESPNTYSRWIPLDNDHFCMDHLIRYNSPQVVVDGLVALTPEEDDEAQEPYLTISGMYVSSVFLAATLAVYSFLPQLRNLHGKVLMAYVASMLVGFLTTGTIQLTGALDANVAELCHVMSMICYFSLLATFFWMNVMSFDIYWTFRGIAKARDINRRGENHKFLMYCLYGFGCPLAMTVIFAILNYLPMDQINTAIVTPGITWKACFISKMERLFYLYAPMSVLILANCALFVATTWNLCEVRRATRSLRTVDSAVQRTTQNRFILYMKVFLLMGLSWALEVVSSFSPQWTVWKFTDAFNLLIGVAIFIIFVCKKKVFKLLQARFRQLMAGEKSGTGRRYSSRSGSSSTTSTSLDQEAFHSEVVNLNPKGRHH